MKQLRQKCYCLLIDLTTRDKQWRNEFFIHSDPKLNITINVEKACVASVGSLSFSFYPSGGGMSCARAWGENQLKDDEKGEGSSLSIQWRYSPLGAMKRQRILRRPRQALLFLSMLCRAVNNDKSNQYCYIPRLSLNKASTVIGWFLVTCPWSNSNVSRPGYNA